MLLRNKVLTFATAGFFGFGMMNIAHAQGLPPDDGGGFEIGVEEPVEEGGLFENLSQYLGATAGATSGSSDAVDKSMQAISVTVDLPNISGVKTAVSFDVGNYENVYKLELSEENQRRLLECQSQFGDPNDIPSGTDPESGETYEEIFYNRFGCGSVIDGDTNEYLAASTERTVDDSFTELTEGYIQWEPTSFATLRFGRQPIVLGQFEVFSPLMFTTPMKATGTKTKTNKADMSYAQDGLQVSLFPLPQLEVSFTSISKMRIDPANEGRFKEFALLKGDGTNFMPNTDQVETLEDIGEHDMSVARVMYFGDRFTFGLTQLDGAETNEDPLREARLTDVSCDSYFTNQPPQGTQCREHFDETGEYFDTYALTDDKGLRYAEMEAFAFELAIRLTPKLSFIIEQTTVEAEKEFETLPNGAAVGARPSVWVEGSQEPTDLTSLWRDIVADNAAKPYINVETVMQSAGLVYQGERWLINFQLAQRTQEGASAQEENWRKQLDPMILEGEDDEDDILPILNAVRLLGAEKEGYAGFGFGSFGQNFGFGLSAGWRFFEKLEIGGFAGMALDVTGADEIEAQGYETPESDAYASFGINYLF